MTTTGKREEIVSLYRSGLRLIDIAGKVGLSRERVRQVMASYPDYVQRGEQVAKRREKVAKLHRTGADLASISRSLGFPRTTVKHDLSVLGLLGRYQQKIEARRQKVRQLLVTDISLREISEVLDVDPSTVSHDIRVMGLQRRPRGTPAQVAARREKVKALWNKQLSMREISAQLGVPVSTIQGDVVDLPRRHERLVRKATRR